MEEEENQRKSGRILLREKKKKEKKKNKDGRHHINLSFKSIKANNYLKNLKYVRRNSVFSFYYMNSFNFNKIVYTLR